MLTMYLAGDLDAVNCFHYVKLITSYMCMHCKCKTFSNVISEGSVGSGTLLLGVGREGEGGWWRMRSARHRLRF